MKVSAIVATHDRAHVLPRALASIAAQSHRDIGVIVVDDGSADETDRAVHRISASFPFLIRYYRQPRSGIASARNLGLKVASGDAIAFLDADDEWMPAALEGLARALETTGADFVYSPAIEVGAEGRETLVFPVAARQPERLARDHFECSNLHVGAALFRRRAIDEVGAFDESLRHGEEADFLQRASIHCTAAYVDEPSVRVYGRVEAQASPKRAAVLRARLESSERILAENPDFARSLGQGGKRRIDEIRAQLLEALILEGDFGMARRLARETRTRSDFGQRIALAVRSRRPYTFARRLRSAWQRWSKAEEAV